MRGESGSELDGEWCAKYRAKLGSSAWQGESIYQPGGRGRHAGSDLRMYSSSQQKYRTVSLLPPDRHPGSQVEGSPARHHWNHVGEFPVCAARDPGVEP